MLSVVGDVTRPKDLVHIRDTVAEGWSIKVCSETVTDHSAWGGLDTLHLISGLPSIQPILDIATTESGQLPSVEGLENLRDEARRCADVNFTGVTLAIAAFVRGSAAKDRR